LTSRERVQAALEHREADRVPCDLGATTVSGMHVDMVYKLRQALGLDLPGTAVKLIEPFQMLGEVTRARVSTASQAWGRSALSRGTGVIIRFLIAPHCLRTLLSAEQASFLQDRRNPVYRGIRPITRLTHSVLAGSALGLVRTLQNSGSGGFRRAR